VSPNHASKANEALPLVFAKAARGADRHYFTLLAVVQLLQKIDCEALVIIGDLSDMGPRC